VSDTETQTVKKWQRKTVELDSLVFDQEYQMRAKKPDGRAYLAVIQQANGEYTFPPLTVAQIGSQYYVVDGFTRGDAVALWNKKNPDNQLKVPIRVRQCTKKQALRLALGANADNGYRRTNADKRMAVMRAMSVFPTLSPKKIAEYVNVSHTFVYRLRDALANPGSESTAQSRKEAAEAAKSAASAESKYQQQQTAKKSEDKSKPSNATKPDQPVQQDVPTISTSALAKKLGPCPNCDGTEWTEENDGYTCNVCLHPYGEPAGDDDGNSAKNRKHSGRSDMSELSVDMKAKQFKEARKVYGDLVRKLNDLGLFKSLEKQLSVISAALVAKK